MSLGLDAHLRRVLCLCMLVFSSVWEVAYAKNQMGLIGTSHPEENGLSTTLSEITCTCSFSSSSTTTDDGSIARLMQVLYIDSIPIKITLLFRILSSIDYLYWRSRECAAFGKD
jgi:hypothetical protein